MPDVYYDAQAVGANNGTSKVDAFTTLAAAVAATSGTDKIWASHTSAEIPGALTLTFNNQRIISVDFSGSTPPAEADYTPGASLNHTTASDFTFNGGRPVFRGISFGVGDDLRIFSGDHIMEDGTITLTGAGDLVAPNAGRLTFINMTIHNATASSGIKITTAGAEFIMIGGSVTGNPTVSNLVLTAGLGGVTIFEGVDLTDVTGQLIQFTSSANVTKAVFKGCLLNAGVVLSTNFFTLNEAALYGSSDTNKPYYIEESMFTGTVQAETTIIKTDGSRDGVTPISLKFVSNANALQGYHPLKNQMPILFWADTIGNNTFEVEVLTDGLILTEEDAWLELFHPQAGVQRALATSLVREGANLAASVVDWTTTGLGAPNKQKISLTVNVGQKGWIEAYICFARPSAIMYADVKILDGSRQYLAGQAYINSESLTCDNAPVGKVIEGTVYDFGNLTGTYKEVPEAKAEINYQYGAGGVEFTGTLSPFTATYELPQEIIYEDEEIIILEGCEP
jgi:hypothetical protein